MRAGRFHSVQGFMAMNYGYQTPFTTLVAQAVL